MHEFVPEDTPAAVFHRSGNFGTFQIQLVAVTEDNIFPFLWIDSDGDDRLDLVDNYDPIAQINQSELSRNPRYDPIGENVGSFGFDKSNGFKFVCDGTFYDLDDVDPSEFSFDMTPSASGWRVPGVRVDVRTLSRKMLRHTVNVLLSLLSAILVYLSTPPRDF
jgi:hypothetical protein